MIPSSTNGAIFLTALKSRSRNTHTGEVELCDILVSIIGGRYGTGSVNDPYSISQAELRKAIELDKPVYIFVQASVHSEYRTFLANEDNEEVKYNFVDDKRVFKFLKEVYSLPRNNAITSFDTARDIENYLRE